MQEDTGDFELRQALRDEKMKRNFKKFLPWVIGASCAVIIATLGFQFYKYRENSKHIQGAELFDEYLANPNTDVLDELKDYSDGYYLVALLTEVEKTRAAENFDDALKLIEGAGGDSSLPLRYKRFIDILMQDILIQAGDYDYDSVSNALEGYSKAGEPWRHRALILLAEIEAQNNNYEKAQSALKEIISDSSVGDDFRLLSQKLYDALLGL